MEMDSNYFGTERISKILFKIAPPVMLAQLIQALYNIVDSFFVGNYSEEGLTALSIIYPLQLLLTALAVGTGVGINTSVSFSLGTKNYKKAEETSGMSAPIALVSWILFAIISFFIMPAYARMSTNSEVVIREVITYGRIIGVCSIGLYTESCWTKVLQAYGDMKTPMIAQVVGALVNIILDPILIFGLLGLPKMGIAGAAIATVAGQIIAALIVMPKGYKKTPSINKYPKGVLRIYKLGAPNIIMQSTYTFYILGLNLILATFSDQAVTALGLYYKWQTFFIIPLMAFQTCIVPVIGFNYASKKIDRCKKTLIESTLAGMGIMLIGIFCFAVIPEQLLRVFTKDPEVIAIGIHEFRVICISFIPLVTSLIFPVFFQAVGYGVRSSLLTLIRTVGLIVPLGYLFAKFGLNYFWYTFPVTEIITTIIGILFYISFIKQEKKRLI